MKVDWNESWFLMIKVDWDESWFLMIKVDYGAVRAHRQTKLVDDYWWLLMTIDDYWWLLMTIDD